MNVRKFKGIAWICRIDLRRGLVDAELGLGVP